ncbi:MAG: hypothetical protein FJW68_03055 [Actinobacteria bacterium]|nr:hypothetical protein [Actinomycetota bacterium]
MKKKNLSACFLTVIIMFFIFLICSCRQETAPEALCYRPSYPASFEILSQNAMLIPLEAVAPLYRQRASLLAEKLAGSGFNIAGLQEIFWDKSQNMILDAWHESLNSPGGASSIDRFENIYGNIKNARDVDALSSEENAWGINIIDARPGGNSKTARITFGPYYVLGPDTSFINFLKQDSGLLILSRYPIIAASAFCFSDLSGTDRLAGKGVLYARIKVGIKEDDYIHFFNTHLQSHNHPETRFKNLEELFDFAGKILLPELNAMGHINPVIMVGDFNVSADMPAGWIEKAGIVSAGKDAEMPDDFDITANKSGEFAKFIELFNTFSKSIGHDPFIIKDLWSEFFPQEPGFTWIGKEWKLTDKNPYGKDGNTVALEEGPPQRIDYIFYFQGSGKTLIKPSGISLFPQNAQDFQISDHLGLQAGFTLD